MRGLPVSTTSKPDLVPLVHGNPKEGDQLWMGEFKNADRYNKQKASAQCLMRWLGRMYWLRTVLGKPLEAVYGFYVAKKGAVTKLEHTTMLARSSSLLRSSSGV